MRLAPALGILVGLAWFAALLVPPIASSGNLLDDPKGFQGIVWGSPLAAATDLTLSETGEHINGYDLKESPPPLVLILIFPGRHKINVKGSGQECPLYTMFTYFASVTCSRDSL